MFKRLRWFVILPAISILLPVLFSPTFASETMPLSIDDVHTYIYQEQLFGTMAVCNTAKEDFRYRLYVHNDTANTYYKRDLLAKAEACAFVELHLPLKFSAWVGDTLEMRLQLLGLKINSPYDRRFSAKVSTIIAATKAHEFVLPTIQKTPKPRPSVKKPSTWQYRTLRGRIQSHQSLKTRYTPVQIIDANHRVVAETHTNSSGHFQFKNVRVDPAQHYDLVALFSDYIHYRKRIPFNDHRELGIDFTFDFTPEVSFSYKYLAKRRRFVLSQNILYEGRSIVVGAEGGAKAGFDLENEQVVQANNGTFYVDYSDTFKAPAFFVVDAHSGVIDLGQAPLSDIRFVPSQGYRRSEPIHKGHNYAFYDAPNRRHAVIHVDDMLEEVGRSNSPDVIVMPGDDEPPTIDLLKDHNNEPTLLTEPIDSPLPKASVPAVPVSKQKLFFGIVSDESGTPLIGVHVTINESDGNEILVTTTDHTGRYEFDSSRLKADQAYEIRARYEKMSPALKMLDRTRVRYDLKLYSDRKIAFEYKYNPRHFSFFTYRERPFEGATSVFTAREGAKLAGFTFLNRQVTNVSDSAFYVGMDDGVLKLYGDNPGQGGVINLGRGPLEDVGGVPEEGYERNGVPLKVGHNYAIYDQRNDIFAVIHVSRIWK
jgi:hypothetical protein